MLSSSLAKFNSNQAGPFISASNIVILYQNIKFNNNRLNANNILVEL